MIIRSEDPEIVTALDTSEFMSVEVRDIIIFHLLRIYFGLVGIIIADYTDDVIVSRGC